MGTQKFYFVSRSLEDEKNISHYSFTIFLILFTKKYFVAVKKRSHFEILSLDVHSCQ